MCAAPPSRAVRAVYRTLLRLALRFPDDLASEFIVHRTRFLFRQRSVIADACQQQQQQQQQQHASVDRAAMLWRSAAHDALDDARHAARVVRRAVVGHDLLALTQVMEVCYGTVGVLRQYRLEPTRAYEDAANERVRHCFSLRRDKSVRVYERSLVPDPLPPGYGVRMLERIAGASELERRVLPTVFLPAPAQR